MHEFTIDSSQLSLNHFLQKQHEQWKFHVRDSISALLHLCKQAVLNVKAICMLAADIIDMSKRTPSYLGDETYDMRAYLSYAILKLAKTDVKNLPVINKHVNVIVEYVEV